MNQNQKNTIEDLLISFKELPFEDIIREIYKDRDVENTYLGFFKIPEYVFNVKKLFRQFSSEFKVNGFLLPFQYQFQNEFGGGNLQSDLQTLINQIKSSNESQLINSAGFINRLIYYQISNGFWDKSIRKIHKADEEFVVKLSTELGVISNSIKEKTSSLNASINKLNAEKDNLAEFISQKNQELQKIVNNSQTSTNNAAEIANLLNTSISTNEKINSILEKQNQSLEYLKEKYDTEDENYTKLKESFEQYEEQIKGFIKDISNQLNSFNKSLDFINSKKQFFEDRNEYLTNLIGREVGVSLFETFNQRKKELEQPVKNWQKVVIGFASLAFVAIITIFTNVFGFLGEINLIMSTEQLISNSLKTLPFFFLLFYAISQYNKERNFQEEYAFKSAVALTIKAYSDLIGKKDLKDDLIITSVNNVYKSPTVSKHKPTKEDENILSTAKELLKTAIDLLKKKLE